MHLRKNSCKNLFAILTTIGVMLTLLASTSLARDPIRIATGVVTNVSDGDTIHVTTADKTKLRVRLYGIDAPETPKINQRTGKVNKPAIWR